MSRAYWILLVLTLANLVNVMDRTLLTVLIQPIKTDLHLSDTQLGLLLGASFAVVYSLAGFRCAAGRPRIASTGSRRLGAGLVCDDLAERPGPILLAVRRRAVGVAAGEAGLLPAGYGLISSCSPHRGGAWRRGLRLGPSARGRSGGQLRAPPGRADRLAGRLHGRRSPQSVAPADVLPGFPEGGRGGPPIPLEFLADAKRLLSSRAYRNLWIGHAVATLFGYSLGGFFVAFMMRTHGLSAKQAGLVVAVSSVTTAWRVSSPAESCTTWRKGTAWPRALSGDRRPHTVVGVRRLGAIGRSDDAGGGAHRRGQVPVRRDHRAHLCERAQPFRPELRATSSALIGLSTSLIGATFGPLIAGALSDLLHPWAGDSALRYALLCAPVFEIVGAVLLWRAAGRQAASALWPMPTASRRLRPDRRAAAAAVRPRPRRRLSAAIVRTEGRSEAEAFRPAYDLGVRPPSPRWGRGRRAGRATVRAAASRRGLKRRRRRRA